MSLIANATAKQLADSGNNGLHSNSVTTKDLQKPELYLNRELSWLKFNRRVLNEALDPRTPLLDRVKFLAIVSSNIDEFCMKRVGGLRLQVAAGVAELTVDGRDPVTQIKLCTEEIVAIGKAKEEIYKKTISELRDNKIVIHDYSTLRKCDRKALRTYYLAHVHPLITPQVVDISHPFPFVSNLSLNLFATLKRPGRKKIITARIKVPVGGGLRRFIKLPSENSPEDTEYARLEDIIMHNLDLLFPNMDILSCDIFRITRNANTLANHSDAADLVERIKVHLRQRKFAPVVRLQSSRSMQSSQQASLVTNLGLDANHTIQTVNTMTGMADLMELALLDRPELKGPKHRGVENHALQGDEDIFSQINQHKSILLQHPFECFETSVERFAKEASIDPYVRAIKMTIYRTSTDTGIVGHLIEAARNGKQVAVVVELTASFDENANIAWANKLEQAGIHVSYGIYGQKTHCKAILVVRAEKGGLCRYAHIGTGNYHANNARIYSDFGLLTCDPSLTADLSELFNYLTTGCEPLRDYDQLLTAPLYIKNALLQKISREAEFARQGKDAHIRFKANALEDTDITAALYEASGAGVRVDLIIRDICRLRPGLPDISENIQVISIVGQFLEHSRIYHFHNGGNDEYFLGSADLMTRNLERRVEIMVPVQDPRNITQLSWVLQTQLADRRNAWEMMPDGDYAQRTPQEKSGYKGSQEMAILQAAASNISIDTDKNIILIKEVDHG